MRKSVKGKAVDRGLRLAIEAAGSRYRLAQLLKLTNTAVYKWRRVPVDRVLQVERLTGVAREHLRPELYAR